MNDMIKDANYRASSTRKNVLRSGVLSPATMSRVVCLYRSLCEDGLGCLACFLRVVALNSSTQDIKSRAVRQIMKKLDSYLHFQALVYVQLIVMYHFIYQFVAHFFPLPP